MGNIEIQVHNEINDYKEKIYFFNFRQWIFAILIVVIVIPTYFFLKNKIGEQATSYIVILIAGILGFIGFIKIHELAAEKILPYWIRHYFFFAKPVKYITDHELLEMQKQKKRIFKKGNKTSKNIEKLNVDKLMKNLSQLSKEEQKRLLKLLEKQIWN